MESPQIIENKFSLKKFLFGSIRKKINFSFSIIIIFLIILLFMGHNLNNKIQIDSQFLREVNAPLNVMVEQVIGYDARLTSNAQWALLYAYEGNLEGIKKHEEIYNDLGVKMDKLLKFDAKELINKSRRSEEEKNLVYGYLDELDEINLKLVDLELNAFNSMKTGNIEAAKILIVGQKYDDYKEILSENYDNWIREEARISNVYEEKILINTQKAEQYNLMFGIFFIIISLIIPFLINSKIIKPITEVIEATKEIEKGNFKSRVNIKSSDELESLGKTFNKTANVLENRDKEHKQLEKAKTEFLSITSHELRSPMTPMRAQLQMLEKEYFGKLNNKQLNAIDIVLRNTEHLDKIIVDFLDISRIEAARLKFRFIKTDLTKHIKRVIDEARSTAPAKHIKFIVNIDKLPVIEVDPDRVMQVFRNLLTNAVKFCTLNCTIEINVKKQKTGLLFMVKDSGEGMSPDVQARIFEPFFQGEQTMYRGHRGTGLGLSIARGIVESQNGKIWVESEKNKGSTFSFTIPYKPIKEIKPIKLLFSEQANKEKALSILFREVLGPMGANEFKELGRKNLINRKDLIIYVGDLLKKGIINNENSIEFKNKINNVYGFGKKINIE